MQTALSMLDRIEIISSLVAHPVIASSSKIYLLEEAISLLKILGLPTDEYEEKKAAMEHEVEMFSHAPVLGDCAWNKQIAAAVATALTHLQNKNESIALPHIVSLLYYLAGTKELPQAYREGCSRLVKEYESCLL